MQCHRRDVNNFSQRQTGRAGASIRAQTDSGTANSATARIIAADSNKTDSGPANSRIAEATSASSGAGKF
jgi:hypothetical protein